MPLAEREHRGDREVRPHARVVERQRAQLLGGAGVADPRGVELNWCVPAGDLDRRFDAADFQLRVDVAQVARDEREVGDDELAEARRRRC